MKFTRHLITASLLGLAALSSTLAAEGTSKASGLVAQACHQDMQTLCPDTKPGDGRIRACMRKNHAKLSDGCKEAFKEKRKNSTK